MKTLKESILDSDKKYIPLLINKLAYYGWEEVFKNPDNIKKYDWIWKDEENPKQAKKCIEETIKFLSKYFDVVLFDDDDEEMYDNFDSNDKLADLYFRLEEPETEARAHDGMVFFLVPKKNKNFTSSVYQKAKSILDSMIYDIYCNYVKDVIEWHIPRNYLR